MHTGGGGGGGGGGVSEFNYQIQDHFGQSIMFKGCKGFQGHIPEFRAKGWPLTF